MVLTFRFCLLLLKVRTITTAERKGTINTQAAVGAKLMFLNVATGFPGCMHDAQVLQHTVLFRMTRQGEILSKPPD